jgi:hypothetical protein
VLPTYILWNLIFKGKGGGHHHAARRQSVRSHYLKISRQSVSQNRNQNTNSKAQYDFLGREVPTEGQLRVRNSSKCHCGWYRGQNLYSRTWVHFAAISTTKSAELQPKHVRSSAKLPPLSLNAHERSAEIKAALRKKWTFRS